MFAHAPTFDAWPAEVQEAVRASVREAVAQQRSQARAAEVDARRKLQAQGVQIVELDEAARAAFRALAAPVLDAFRAQHGERLLRLAGWTA